MLGGVEKLGRDLLRADALGWDFLFVAIGGDACDARFSELLRFLLVVRERQYANIALYAAHGDALSKDVDAQHFLFAQTGRDDLPFLRKPLAALHVELVLVAEAAHQTPAGARDL